MTSPLRRYISAFPRCTVTDSNCIAHRTNAPIGSVLPAGTVAQRFGRVPLVVVLHLLSKSYCRREVGVLMRGANFENSTFVGTEFARADAKGANFKSSYKRVKGKPHSGKTKSQSPTKTPCNQPAIAILTHTREVGTRGVMLPSL